MSSQPLFRLRGLPVETHLLEAQSKRIVQGIKEQSHSSMTVDTSLIMHESDNMSTLHAKLHREADKIRKWKVQIELELRDKEKKLTEAALRIEAMKKSLLDLQLENERSHAKLQDEMSNREEVMRSVQTTRDLCNILRCEALKLDDKLTKCEAEKTELKLIESEYVHHYEELNEKFNCLKIAAKEKETEIQNLVKVDRESALQREKELTKKLKTREKEVF
ncbi:unnamed protein product [Lymnaea stagnalis]|uniref:Uncharacterized protein n=1 Tax=Lymnaea stagnalis TaxID=6523 RepID=A0AAV2IFE0_LYMST